MLFHFDPQETQNTKKLQQPPKGSISQAWTLRILFILSEVHIQNKLIVFVDCCMYLIL